MMAKKVSGYLTANGEFFHTQRECQQYEAYNELRGRLENEYGPPKGLGPGTISALWDTIYAMVQDHPDLWLTLINTMEPRVNEYVPVQEKTSDETVERGTPRTKAKRSVAGDADAEVSTSADDA